MKKVIFAVLAMFALTAVAGEYGDVTVGSTKMDKTDVRLNHGIVTFGNEIGSWDLQGRLGVNRTTNTAVNTDAAELRARYNFSSIFGFKPWVRATAGQQFATGDRYGYWAVEPGVGRSWTNAFRTDLSVSRKETWSTNWRNVDSTSYILANSYAVDKKNAFALYLTRAGSGLKSDTIEVGYTRSF